MRKTEAIIRSEEEQHAVVDRADCQIMENLPPPLARFQRLLMPVLQLVTKQREVPVFDNLDFDVQVLAAVQLIRGLRGIVMAGSEVKAGGEYVRISRDPSEEVGWSRGSHSYYDCFRKRELYPRGLNQGDDFRLVTVAAKSDRHSTDIVLDTDRPEIV